MIRRRHLQEQHESTLAKPPRKAPATHARLGSPRFAVAGLAILGLVVAGLTILGLPGCGEQDLYRPPDCPFEISGRVSLRTEAQDVDVLDNYAYVAAGQGGLQVVDITDPDNPRQTDWINTKKFAEAIVAAQTYDNDGSPRKIAFVVDGTEGITTFDISSPDTLIDFRQGTGAYDGKGLSFVPPAMMTDPYMLFLADSWRGITVFLQIMDTPGALDFQRAGELRIFTYGYTKAIIYADGYLYVAEDEMGITVVDATALPSGGLVLLENFETPGNALDVAVENGYLFVADNEQGLHVMRIGEDYLVESVTSLALDGECRAIAVRNGTAFLAAEDAGLHVVDVRDPAKPSWLGNVPTSHALGVAVGNDDIVCIADRDEGLIVFRGPDFPDDSTPPAAVSDLTARLTGVTSLVLSWTAPGNDGMEGTAELYDMRWSQEPIADSTWDATAELVRRPFPQPPGTAQSFDLEELTPGTTYYFALKTRDDASNWSEISNSASAIMTTPVLSADIVAPASGDISTTFTYSVTYSDPEGDPPTVHDVIIDGIHYPMAPIDIAPDYTLGAAFEYATTLSYGSHEYQFAFDDGHGPLVTTTLTPGPALPSDPFDFEMHFIDVAGGTTFSMGSPAFELGREADETEHDVTLTKDYYISEIEVTQTLYEVLMGQNPAGFEGVSRPVETVTWYDAVKFCNEFSDHDGYTQAYTILAESYDDQGHLIGAIVSWDPEADGYRLPTEAEWEYACRAGSETALANGELSSEYCDDPLLDAIGWYCGNSDTGTGRKPQDVGSREPNAFGLYDMHGNVWEWCWDRYGDYPDSAVSDPTGPAGEEWEQRVRRGGHYDYYARDCRSASRGDFWPGSADDAVGFRVVRDAE